MYNKSNQARLDRGRAYARVFNTVDVCLDTTLCIEVLLYYTTILCMCIRVCALSNHLCVYTIILLYHVCVMCMYYTIVLCMYYYSMCVCIVLYVCCVCIITHLLIASVRKSLTY